MNKNDLFNRLKQLVSIESVSTDPSRKEEMIKAAKHLKKELENVGMDVVLLNENGCHPLIFGKKIIDKTLKTSVIYAHYDVQPEDPVYEWESPPFDLTQRGEKLYGRGVADDKMHLVQAIAAIGDLVKNNKLAQNIIFIFEGEEEEGSVHLEEILKKSFFD